MGGMERWVWVEWKGWYRWNGNVSMGGMERWVWVEWKG